MSQINVSANLGASSGATYQGPEGYTLLNTTFLPAWNNIDAIDPTRHFSYSRIRFFNASVFGTNDLFATMTQSVINQFLAIGEGTVVSTRMWKKDVVSVGIPTEICTPGFLPFGAGGQCVTIPVIGGTELASVEDCIFEVIYHNPVELVGVWAFLTIALFAISALLIADALTGGDLGLTDIIKSTIEGWTPGFVVPQATGSITTILVLAIGAVIAIAVAFPNVGTSVQQQIRTPIGTTTIGASPRASSSGSRR